MIGDYDVIQSTPGWPRQRGDEGHESAHDLYIIHEGPRNGTNDLGSDRL
jgi:hypothetical protein